jgi:hypothetical protein
MQRHGHAWLTRYFFRRDPTLAKQPIFAHALFFSVRTSEAGSIFVCNPDGALIPVDLTKRLQYCLSDSGWQSVTDYADDFTHGDIFHNRVDITVPFGSYVTTEPAHE